jgi:hypothetical protein
MKKLVFRMGFGDMMVSMMIKIITPFVFLLSEITLYYKGSKIPCETRNKKPITKLTIF